MRKFGAMFVVLLVALGLVGATYAVWTDTVKVSGTVSTGKFDVNIISVTCDPVNYATVTTTVGNGNATVDITDAYPGLVVSCTFTVENAGTVPANAVSLSYKPKPLPDYVTVTGIPQYLTLNPGASQNIAVSLTFNSNTPEEASFTYEVTVEFRQHT